jgi:hypothetical protein
LPRGLGIKLVARKDPSLRRRCVGRKRHAEIRDGGDHKELGKKENKNGGWKMKTIGSRRLRRPRRLRAQLTVKKYVLKNTNGNASRFKILY